MAGLLRRIRDVFLPPAPPPPKPKRRGQRKPKTLRGDEPEQIIEAASSPLYRTIFLVLRYCGLRVSEAACLEVQDIDLEGRTLHVLHGKGDKDRNVPINPKLVGELETWIAGRRTGWLFPSPKVTGEHISTRSIQNQIKEAAARAGIPRNVHPHLMRHTFATQMLKRGGNIRAVQELLGHSSLQVTQVYLSVDVDDLQQTTDLL